jgi:mannose-6-phosphate isomerase
MHKLNCGIQKYGWGRKGGESSAALYKKAQDESFQIDPDQAYAELWMGKSQILNKKLKSKANIKSFFFFSNKGTHVNCPSSVNLENETVTLSEYLKQDTAKSLGETIARHFYTEDSIMKAGDLPFLFKVLSINQALSIQAHPNKQLARQLHARDPKHYPDSNHKPEMLIAISDKFEAMCGFRPSSEIVENFVNYPELVAMCDKDNCDEFIALRAINSLNRQSLELSLRKCFTALMTKTESFILEEFNRLKSRIESSGPTRTDLDRLFMNLARQYPNDVGCFSIFLLNCLTLNKGEAIFLSANVPHAYLFGDGVECMACSDNVVRAGLTPKFKDVTVLCDMLDYTMRSSEENKLEATRTSLSQDLDYLVEFRPSVDEFSVQQIRIEDKHAKNASSSFLLPKSDSGSILILNEVNSDVKCHLERSDGSGRLDANAGLVFFIDAGHDVNLVVETNSGEKQSDESSIIVLAYRAYCDLKSN